MLASNDFGEVMGTVLTVQAVGLDLTIRQEDLYNCHSLNIVVSGVEQMDDT